MAPMKKFTPAQEAHVRDLRRWRHEAQSELAEVRRERDKLNEQFQETVKNAVRAQADLDKQFQDSKEMHRELTSAVEDYLEAEFEKDRTARRFEGARGRLDILHSEHSKRIQEPVVMGFNYEEPASRWGRTK